MDECPWCGKPVAKQYSKAGREMTSLRFHRECKQQQKQKVSEVSTLLEAVRKNRAWD